MVEVLVASTILIVIVMMLSMIFQQTSLAWRAGVKRADGYLGIRAVFSAIQRDASAMIDEKNIPIELRNWEQKFSNNWLQFYTLNTMSFSDYNTPLRSLRFIVYKKSGAREEWALESNTLSGKDTKYSNKQWIKINSSSDIRTVAERLENLTPVVPKIKGFEYGTGQQAPEPQASEQPLYLTITAQVTPIGSSFDIGAESSGPDRVFGDPNNPDDPRGKDDIKTWVK